MEFDDDTLEIVADREVEEGEVAEAGEGVWWAGIPVVDRRPRRLRRARVPERYVPGNRESEVIELGDSDDEDEPVVVAERVAAPEAAPRRGRGRMVEVGSVMEGIPIVEDEEGMQYVTFQGQLALVGTTEADNLVQHASRIISRRAARRARALERRMARNARMAELQRRRLRNEARHVQEWGGVASEADVERIAAQLFEQEGPPRAEVKSATGVVDALEEVLLTRHDIFRSEKCVVCLDPYEAGETRALRLGCGHCFCRACISHWAKENDTCPTCRATIRGVDDLGVVDISDESLPTDVGSPPLHEEERMSVEDARSVFSALPAQDIIRHLGQMGIDVPRGTPREELIATIVEIVAGPSPSSSSSAAPPPPPRSMDIEDEEEKQQDDDDDVQILNDDGDQIAILDSTSEEEQQDEDDLDETQDPEDEW